MHFLRFAQVRKDRLKYKWFTRVPLSEHETSVKEKVLELPLKSDSGLDIVSASQTVVNVE